MLKLFFLGTPRIERDGAELRPETRKVTALLAYVAATGQAHTRDALAALLWPDLDPSRGLANLRRTLWSINRALGEVVDADAERIALRRDDGVWTDLERFEAALGRAGDRAALDEAAALYRGDFLAGLTLEDSEAFTEWQFFQAEAWRRRCADVLERLARARFEAGESDSAADAARRWLALDTLNEAAHRRLMELYARTGQRAAALRQYQECARVLRAELGVDPSPETQALHGEIQAGRVAAGSPPAPDARTVAKRPPLPPGGEGLVGREKELDRLRALLASPDAGLITLVGPGGIGKTRLALAAARAPEAGFEDGAWFVPLASLSALDSLFVAVAQTLDLSFAGSTDPRARLREYLSDKRALLILDNFEQYIEAAGELADAARQAPGLKILVTSRERLNLGAEWVVPVDGLAEGDSAALFTQLARRLGATFEPDPAIQSAIVRIVRAVGGMPLAIELAASWTRVMTCAEIAGELERGLDLLRTSQRDLPERHRSLRAVFDHSLDLLSDAERGAFLRLSAFRGGWSRDAAARVAGASLDVLSALADKSLVRLRAGPGGARFDMLEPLRQYASGRLMLDLPEWDAARDRHCEHFCGFLAAREADLGNARQIDAMNDIGADIENVRAAWLWAVQCQRWDDVARAAQALFDFYEIRGWFEEGHDAFRTAAERVPHDRMALRAKLMLRQAWLLRLHQPQTTQELNQAAHALLRAHAGEPGVQQDLALAQLFLPYYDVETYRGAARESLAISRRIGYAFGQVVALSGIGASYLQDGQPDHARDYLAQGLAMAERANDRRSQSTALDALSQAEQMLGEYSLARTHSLRNLELLTELGYRWGMALAADRIGYISRLMGEYGVAEDWHTRSLREHRELNDILGIGGSLCNLGQVAGDRGDHAAAVGLLSESLEYRRRAGDPWVIAYSSIELAYALLALGRVDEARAAVAAVDTLDGVERSHWIMSQAHATRAECDMQTGELTGAAASLERALDRARQVHSIEVVERVRLTQARVLRALGRTAEAAAGASDIVARRVAGAAVLRQAEAMLSR